MRTDRSCALSKHQAFFCACVVVLFGIVIAVFPKNSVAIKSKAFGSQLLSFYSEKKGNDEVSAHDLLTNSSATLAYRRGSDERNPRWSPNGWSLALESSAGGRSDIFVMSAAGSGWRNLSNTPGSTDVQPAWSPDGKQIVFVSDRAGSRDLWVMGLDGSDLRRLTFTSGAEGWPSWSPDGARIAYRIAGRGTTEIYTITFDGKTRENVSNSPGSVDTMPSWHPDGKRIVFSSNRTGNIDLFAVDLDSGRLQNLTNTNTVDERHASWSQDGLQLAYEGHDGHVADLYVANADGTSSINVTRSTINELSPSWRPKTQIDNSRPGSRIVLNNGIPRGSNPEIQSDKRLKIKIVARDKRGSGISAVRLTVVEKGPRSRCKTVLKHQLKSARCFEPPKFNATIAAQHKKYTVFEYVIPRRLLKKMKGRNFKIESRAVDGAGNQETNRTKKNKRTIHVR